MEVKPWEVRCWKKGVLRAARGVENGGLCFLIFLGRCFLFIAQQTLFSPLHKEESLAMGEV